MAWRIVSCAYAFNGNFLLAKWTQLTFWDPYNFIYMYLKGLPVLSVHYYIGESACDVDLVCIKPLHAVDAVHPSHIFIGPAYRTFFAAHDF